MLTVTVRNGAGSYAMGLHRAAFEVTDEKEVRPVEFFEVSATPVSVGILIDTSRSMQAVELLDVTRAKSLSEAFSKFFEMSNANNEYFLAAFDETPRFLTDWLSGQELLAKKSNWSENGMIQASLTRVLRQSRSLAPDVMPRR